MNYRNSIRNRVFRYIDELLKNRVNHKLVDLLQFINGISYNYDILNLFRQIMKHIRYRKTNKPDIEETTVNGRGNIIDKRVNSQKKLQQTITTKLY